MIHDWDMKTGFCLKCGRAMTEDVNERKSCSSKNVIPISHIISERRLTALVFGNNR